ncbi:hypothetical protein [Nocardioides montaniterrae]
MTSQRTRCGLLEEVPATSQKLACSGDLKLPKHHEKLTVQNPS